MIKKLKELNVFLNRIDKSAAHSVGRLIRKSSGPYDAIMPYERYPEDQEGSWDPNDYSNVDIGAPDTQSTTGIEMSPDAGGLVSTEEMDGIKAYLRSFQQENGGIYSFMSAMPISSPDNDGRKVWRVFSEFKSDPIDVPTKETIEWEMWEVYPGEYGYGSSVQVPGTDMRIYGEA